MTYEGIEIAPCPFCGFSMILVYNDGRVVCGNCSAQIRRRTIEEAVKVWNRRVDKIEG